VVPADSPSYGELAAVVRGQGELIARLEAEIAALRAENADLKWRLGMNSQNSSMPPSTDSPFDKPAPKSLRRRSGRKPGGQPGHRGSTLQLVDDPDETVVHEPGVCMGCGADLADAPQANVERRQVFDLPPMTVRVTEHQLIARRCGCGTTTCATTPHGVAAPVQYGPQITAIVVFISGLAVHHTHKCACRDITNAFATHRSKYRTLSVGRRTIGCHGETDDACAGSCRDAARGEGCATCR
jgi:transposase